MKPGKTRFKENTKNKHIGSTFGMLTVNKVFRDCFNKVYLADCSCECGTKSYLVRLYDLTRNHTKSCGCLKYAEQHAKKLE